MNEPEGILRELKSIPREQLSRADQVDAALLAKRLEFQIWKQLELREWSWNPLIYTGLSGTSIYSLMARDFAPVDIRLKNVVHFRASTRILFGAYRDGETMPTTSRLCVQ